MLCRRKICWLQIFTTYQRFTATLSESRLDTSQNFAKPETVSLDYWKKVLWVAMDLKNTLKENNKNSLDLLGTKHIAMLFKKPQGRFHLAFSLACDLLNARKTLHSEYNLEEQIIVADSGRVMSQLADMIITHDLCRNVVTQLSSQSTIPIFPTNCNTFCLQRMLSDLMTFQENFNRLKGLTIGWVGPPNSILNTYLMVCPKFSMNIKYTCICSHGSGKMSPVNKLSFIPCNLGPRDFVSELKTAEEVVSGSQIVISSLHPDTRYRIDLEMLKKADENWMFIHTLPRSEAEVSNDVFEHKRNLTWQTSENFLYTIMAIILTNLKDHTPKIKMPNFDDDETSSCSSKL